ncbi:MAG: hypothetical protein L3K00_00070 [Thermoplasmata archaeon]|nr:hypothetical protein [Thermoplasmata archaeon]
MAVLLAVGVAAVQVVAAFELPVTTDFSLSVRSQGLTASVEYRTFPTGAQVSFSWDTSSGRTVTFSLLGAGGQVLSTSSAASGNLSFTAEAGPYGFQSYSWLPEFVTVAGNYASPVLR